MEASYEEPGRPRIAMIVGTALREGPFRWGLEHAGYQVRDMVTTDQAAACVQIHGTGACLLALDARSLDERDGSATWRTLLERMPDLPAVLVACGGTPPRAREAAHQLHRVLVEEPFDAAAVVAGATAALAVPGPAGGGRPMERVRPGPRPHDSRVGRSFPRGR